MLYINKFTNTRSYLVAELGSLYVNGVQRMQAKYEIVEDGVKEKILAGTYAIGDKLPTETELMNEYEVSRYTVRRAIGDLENEDFVYRIQGGGMYVNDWQTAQTNKNNSNRMIGVIATHVANYIFPSIINGADQIISDNGFSILLANTHNDPKLERRSLTTMLQSDVSGLIIEPTQSTIPTSNRDLYDKVVTLGLPVVFINATYDLPELSAPSVTTNDVGAMTKLTNYLIDQGHERILGVFQVDDIQGVNRMNGFIKAYQEHSTIALKSNIIMYQSMDPIKQVLAKIEHAVKSNSRPTAIMCYNDQLAIRVIDMVKSLNINIPDDISITGFDDYNVVRYIDPAITTMSHEKERMGHDAAQLLMNLINKKPAKSIVYDPEMIVRDSVKKIN